MKEKHNHTDSQNLPACAAEFLRLVIRKMRYRRKVQQDVQAELAAHFEDELKDCATDEDKEQKAQQLITEFGDVKLLAVLMRRAKKRCRPLWRTIIARTFQTAGVIIVCFIFYTIWFLSGKPAISVDYLAILNQMNQPQLQDEDNAWPHYEKAIDLYIAPVPGGVVREFIDFRYKPGQLEKVLRFTDLSEDEQGQILEWIQHNQKYWDNLSPEQQSVVLKCLEYNWVPIFRKSGPVYSYCGYTPFNSMTEHILESIRQKKQLTDSIHTGVGPGYLGFPEAEFSNWVKQGKIPPHFLEAVSVAVLREWMKRYKDFPKGKWAPLTDGEYEYISPWIKKNEPAWQEFVAGSSKLYCYRVVQYNTKDQEKWLLNIVAPHLNTLKKLARLGVWRSRINLKEGKRSQGLEDCLAVARAAGHWQAMGTLVKQLVGLAISALAHEEILHITATQNLSAIDLKQFQQQLEQIYPEGYPLIDIEGERIAFLDIVQHVFTDGGLGGGHLIPQKFCTLMDYINSGPGLDEFNLVTYTAAGMIHARRDETIAKFSELFDKLTENAKMSPYERRIHDIDEGKVILALSNYRFFLIRIFLPAFCRLSDLAYRSKTQHQAMLTILALKRWRLEKSEYPATLGELVTAGFIKELPMDPYSDKPLVYKKTADNFILYSVGPNFTDDDGEPGKDRDGRVAKWRDNGDTVFWPVPEMQSD